MKYLYNYFEVICRNYKPQEVHIHQGYIDIDLCGKKSACYMAMHISACQYNIVLKCMAIHAYIVMHVTIGQHKHHC